MKKIQRKEQSGRSMVEMLGVLAIIGVLSVGGIAGYKAAMDKIKLNNAIRLVDLFVLSVKMENERDDVSPYDNVPASSNSKVVQYFYEHYLGKKNFQFKNNTAYDNGLQYVIARSDSARSQVCLLFNHFPQSQVLDLFTYIKNTYYAELADETPFMTNSNWACGIDPQCVYENYTIYWTGFCLQWIPLE